VVFTRIFVPTDGTDSSLRGLEVAAQLAYLFRSELVVVTVVPLPDWVARQNLEQGAIEAHVEAVAQKVLEQSLPVLRRTGVGAEIRVVVGPAAEVLVAEVGRSRPDLVVMGRRDRDQPKDLLLGSVSDRVARHVKMPVLLVP
jgi:nucleotide-binding universal stress UspA family protein